MMNVNPDRIRRGLWWDRAWQVVDGCTPISPGCANCWSAAQSRMWQHNPNAKIATRHAGLTTDAGAFNGTVRVRADNLDLPARVKKPTVFALWNDLFHPIVPKAYIAQVYQITRTNPRHTFVVLTKRSGRMESLLNESHLLHGTNVIHGVSVCCPAETYPITSLQESLCNGPRMLSVEPLLEPIDLGDLSGIDWIVVGCETGRKRRPCNVEWVRSIVEQGQAAGAAVFVKALNIDGRVVKDLDCFPPDLQLRELPKLAREEPSAPKVRGPSYLQGYPCNG